MVRIIIYLIFILFSCLSANANKIQDCFYECCFGSSYDEIMGKLVLQDYEVEKHASYLAVEGVFFGGVYFDKVLFRFKKNVFYCIEFYSGDNSDTQELHRKIVNKYNCFNIKDISASACDDLGRSVFSCFVSIDRYKYMLSYKDERLYDLCNSNDI